jgi:hypothetical protein
VGAGSLRSAVAVRDSERLLEAVPGLGAICAGATLAVAPSESIGGAGG